MDTLLEMKAVLDDLIQYVNRSARGYLVGWKEEYICKHIMQMEYIPKEATLKLTAIAPDGDLLTIKYNVFRRFFN